MDKDPKIDLDKDPDWPFDNNDIDHLFGNKNTENQADTQDDFLIINNQNTTAYTEEKQENPIAHEQILEPVLTPEPIFEDNALMQQYGPQRIGSADSKYEDTEFFNDLVNTPAILRNKRQDDFEMQNYRAFDLDNDLSEFLKDLPD